MTKRTAEENALLRAEFNKILELAAIEPMDAIMIVLDGRFSINNYMLVENAAELTGLGGVPYVHYSTFQGWLERGYCVNKGQKAVCSVPTIKTFHNKETDSYYKTPRNSYLFHLSQVKEL